MNSTKATIAAIAFAAAAGFAPGPAGAQPRLEQTGDGYSVAYDGAAERGNVAGGRAARIEGGGENAAILYTGPDPSFGGSFATLSGGGDNAVLSYAEPAPAAAPSSMMAGGTTRADTAGRRG